MERWQILSIVFLFVFFLRFTIVATYKYFTEIEGSETIKDYAQVIKYSAITTLIITAILFISEVK